MDGVVQDEVLVELDVDPAVAAQVGDSFLPLVLLMPPPYQKSYGDRSNSELNCDSVFSTAPRFTTAWTLLINSVQTRCIVKGEAQKSPLFWGFSGGF